MRLNSLQGPKRDCGSIQKAMPSHWYPLYQNFRASQPQAVGFLLVGLKPRSPPDQEDRAADKLKRLAVNFCAAGGGCINFGLSDARSGHASSGHQHHSINAWDENMFVSNGAFSIANP